MKIPPPPFNTPISGSPTDQFGVPFQNRPDSPPPSGDLHIAWSAWFNNLKMVLLAVPVVFANLSKFPTNLTKEDVNYLAWDSQYEHMYRWTGSAWTFGPGDDNLAGTITCTFDGNAPRGGIWHAADGSINIPISKGDGTTTNSALPNLSTDIVLMGFTAQSGPNAASAPLFAGGAKTDDESAHTHDMNSHTHQVTVTANTTVQSGAGATIAGAQVDTSGGPSPTSTAAGTAHHHNLSNANAPMDALGRGQGLPLNYQVIYWVRQ